MLEIPLISKSNHFNEYLREDYQRRQLQETAVDEAVSDEEAKETELDDVRAQTIYPEPYFTNDQIKKGAFIFYIVGKYTAYSLSREGLSASDLNRYPGDNRLLFYC